jgi:hypothetical protein
MTQTAAPADNSSTLIVSTRDESARVSRACEVAAERDSYVATAGPAWSGSPCFEANVAKFATRIANLLDGIAVRVAA